MLLSIVVVGRNDDFSKNFNTRLFISAQMNTYNLLEAGVNYEFIFVEWNPVPNKMFLSTEVVRRVKNSRAYACDAKIHQDICTSDKLNFLEFHAKNVGIQRAQGNFILCLNADVIMSMKLIKQIRDIKNDTLYFARKRKDIYDGSFENFQDIENGVHVVHQQFAAGDFTLASRETWDELTGFDEGITFSRAHTDTRLMKQAEAKKIKVRKLDVIYHIYHEQCYWQYKKSGGDRKNAYYGDEYNYKKGLPYDNGKDWGLKGRKESEIANRVVLIKDSDKV